MTEFGERIGSDSNQGDSGLPFNPGGRNVGIDISGGAAADGGARDRPGGFAWDVAGPAPGVRNRLW